MNIKRLVILLGISLLGLSLVLSWLLSTSSIRLIVAHAAGPWYVAPDGSDSNTCLSIAVPCDTINGAIGKASGGDTVYVAIGTYTGTGDEVVLVDKDITLSGGWDAGFTSQSGTSTIIGEDKRRGIFVMAGVTVNVDHFTVQNSDMGGIVNAGILTLTNSIVRDNTDTGCCGGGGIRGFEDSSIVIIDSKIYGNKSIYEGGGGMRLDWNVDLTMIRSWVVGNGAPNDVGGGGINIGNQGSAYIENSVIAGNFSGGNAGGVRFDGDGPYRIINSHIVGNVSDGGGAAIAGQGAVIKVVNTLIISNTGNSGLDDPWGDGSIITLDYCDTYGNSPDGADDVTITRANCLGTPSENGLDPLMAGGTLPSEVGPAFAEQWLSYDYRLLLGSPAIDTGTPIGAPVTDIEGTSRDSTPDLGAYEWAYRLFLPLASK